VKTTHWRIWVTGGYVDIPGETLEEAEANFAKLDTCVIANVETRGMRVFYCIGFGRTSTPPEPAGY
jgi:hypothetical protein